MLFIQWSLSCSVLEILAVKMPVSLKYGINFSHSALQKNLWKTFTITVHGGEAGYRYIQGEDC